METLVARIPRNASTFAGACLLILGLLGAGLSCRQLAPEVASTEPRAELLQGDLSLVMSRLGTYPFRIVTNAEKVPVSMYFDPELIDVRKATKYCLWKLDPGTSGWTRVATIDVGSGPLAYEPREGLVGLWASAIYADGAERLVPRPGDEPALWLCVDRTPPSIRWIEPRDSVSVKGVSTLELRWSSNEVHFGSRMVTLRWSADRGRTWKPIATLPARSGPQSYRWKVPEEVCSDIIVNVASRDLAGQEASASVALAYPGSLRGDGPLLAAGSSPPAPADQADVATGHEAPSVAPATANPADAATVGAAGSAGAGAPVPAVKAPQPEGSSPTVPGAPAARGPVRLDPLPSEYLRGGETVQVSWTFDGAAAPAADAALEWSADGGSTWTPVGQAPLASGRIPWQVPAQTVSGCLLRLRSEPKPGELIEARTAETFAIDAEPPRVSLGELPGVVGPDLRLPVALSDPGGSGIHEVEVHVRPAASESWIRLESSRVRLEGNEVRADLSELEEGTYEVSLVAFDRVGNASPAPVSGAAPGAGATLAADGRAVLQLDRTPPAIRARKGAAPWVSGLPADAEVTVDWEQAVPPLVVEGDSGGESWTQLESWTAIAPGQSRFSFTIPGAIRAFTVRFSVADAVGNRAFAVVGPERVASPIRLKTFLEETTVPAGTLQKIEWELDPVVASGPSDGMLVNVACLRGAGGEWQTVHEASPEKRCLWEVPDGPSDGQRIRVRLVRAGQVIGEDVSATFRVGQVGAPIPVVVNVSEDSLLYSRRARSSLEKYTAALESGGRPGESSELEALRRSIVDDFAKALEADPRNYHAAYGMAQFLNRLDSTKNAREVRQWLERTIEIKPDHVWALNDLGACYIQDGDFARAEERLARSAAVKQSAVILYNLGLARFYGGKPAEAAESLRAALAASKGEVVDGEVYYYLIQCHARLGDPATAQALFREKEAGIPADLRSDLARTLGV